MTTPQGSPGSYGPVPEKDFPWVLIGIGTVVLLACLLGGLFLVFSSLRGSTDDSSSEDPYVPYEAAGCEDNCFTVEDARRMTPDADSLALLGSPASLILPQADSDIVDHHNEANLAYYEAKGKPRACSFDLSTTPIAPSSTTYHGDDDVVVDLGSWGDESRSVAQVTRVMEAPIFANRYHTYISALIARCPGYSLTDDAGTISEFTMTPITLDLAQPDVEVAAWRVDSDSTTRTVVDLRYEQLAIRTTFAGSTWTESEIEGFISATAARLAALND